MEIFKITDFNREEVVKEKRELATVGGSATDLISVVDGSPFRAINKLRFESSLGIRELMVPLQSSYNGGASNEVGRPESDPEDLSPSGDRTRNTSE